LDAGTSADSTVKSGTISSDLHEHLKRKLS
jgi:hypothetical protein